MESRTRTPIILAVIPARGSSKAVSKKNLRLLLGKPLLAHTIELAKQVDRIDRILVSTDDVEIAGVGQDYGAEVMMRPAHLATDDALVIDAIRDLLNRLIVEQSYRPDAVLLLEPTTPLRSVVDVDRCLDLFETGCYDSIATFTEAVLNPHRAWVIEGDVPRPFIEASVPWLPRQQLPECYQLSGAVYLFRPEVVLEASGPSLLRGAVGAVIVPAERSVDIDREIDFVIVETIMRSTSKVGSACSWASSREKILEDKIAIITGASSGVGRAIAKGFLEEGAYVAACARRLERLQQVFGTNDRAFVEKVDVTDPRQMRLFIESICQRFHKIDILVNNAGVNVAGHVTDIDSEGWRYSFGVNVEAPFYFCKLVVPLMKACNYGRIINVSSGAAVNCPQGGSAYNASKAALNAFTRTLAGEVEGYNIKVNMMSPGPCRTEMAPNGTIEPERAVPTAIFLATLPSDGPNGKFFWLMRELEVIPDLSHIPWLNPDLD